MARSVGITMSISTGQSNKNLTSIIRKLNSIKDTIKYINGKGVSLDTSNIKNSTIDFSKLNTEINKVSKKIKDANNDFKKLNTGINSVGTTSKTVKTDIAEFAGSVALIGKLKLTARLRRFSL